MPTFRYKAVKPSGEIVLDVLEAGSRAVAIDAIRERNLLPVSVTSGRRLADLLDLQRAGRRRAGLRAKDLLQLSRQLATLLRSGIHLDRALRLIGEMAPAGEQRDAIRKVHGAVRKGASLADALAEHAGAPVYFSGLVRAGESNGALGEALERLVRHLEQSTKLANDLRSAFYYPAFVVVVAIATLLLMLLVVIPEFRTLFDNGASPPLELRILLALSDFLAGWGWVLLLAAAASAILLRGFLAASARRAVWHRLIRGVPLVGTLIDRIDGARFCRTLGVLHAGGMPLLQGLAVAGAAVSNQDIHRRVAEIVPQVRRGATLSAAIERAAILSKLGNQMLAVGEESGQLERMLLSLADIYEDEVKLQLTRLEAILVPALTIGIGLFVGGIVTIMLTAILGSYDLSAT